MQNCSGDPATGGENRDVSAKIKRFINQEENVRFITNYLSDGKRRNNTRPFYEKTISLYPELEGIGAIENENLRNETIKQAVLRRLADHGQEIR